MDRTYRIGDEVIVKVPNTERFGSRDIKKINGHKYTVSRAYGGKSGPMYELSGVTSRYGIPYSFVNDWLIPVGGSDE